jgi:hypothetical protein
MAEIRCRNCGKKVDGKADLCLFCGKKVSGGGRGNLTGGRRRGFPIGVLLTIILLSCLCCVLGAQLEPVRSAAAALLPSRTGDGLTIPTDVPNPTATVAERRVVSTSTPTPIPVEPTKEKTATPESTQVADGLLPESGGGTSGPFLILALGGTLLLLGWFVHFTLRRA